MSLKLICMTLISTVFVASSLFAAPAKHTDPSLKVLITKVKNAPPSKRRELINQLKIKLRTMQQTTRKQVLLELRHSFMSQSKEMKKGNTMSKQMSMEPMMNNMNVQQMQQMQNAMRSGNMQKPPGTQNSPGNMPMMPGNP